MKGYCGDMHFWLHAFDAKQKEGANQKYLVYWQRSKLFICPSKTPLLALHSTHCQFTNTTKKCHSVNVKEIHLLASIEKKNVTKITVLLTGHWRRMAQKSRHVKRNLLPISILAFFYILTIIYILQAVPSFKCLNGFPSID